MGWTGSIDLVECQIGLIKINVEFMKENLRAHTVVARLLGTVASKAILFYVGYQK